MTFQINNNANPVFVDASNTIDANTISIGNKAALTISEDNINVEAGISFSYPLLNLFDLLLQGKTLENNAKDFLEEIKKLPYVQGDNIKAMAVFNRFRKFVVSKK